ncbi:hypothetical protein [Parasitella parasitica]|uniref:Uncharacterized protein n=1 Tax=Parasitella parasitica TaxID=35722 RepID=A0A0B7NIA3_9FUNG|nr:hypothetical protein [Parasitella parasitica]
MSVQEDDHSLSIYEYLDMMRTAKSMESGNRKNYSKALNIYKSIPAYVSWGEAPYRAGKLLMEGDKYLKQNYAKAKAYLEVASEWKKADARYELGRMYDYGWGLEVDVAQAKRLYHQALDLGCYEASKKIGLKFLHAPQGVQYDLDRAKKHLLIYEEHFAPDAETHMGLGHCYRLGKGPNYFKLAMDRYMKAVDLDVGYGCHCIGLLYEGLLQKNMAQAIEWYEKGAAMNNAQSMLSLGKLYVSGIHTRKDFDSARNLFTTASKLGLATAEKELESLEAEIGRQNAALKEKEKADREKADREKAEKEKAAGKPADELSKKTLETVEPEKEGSEKIVDSGIAKKPKTTNKRPASDEGKPDVEIIRKPVNSSQVEEMSIARHSNNAINQLGQIVSQGKGYQFKTKADLREQCRRASRNYSPSVAPRQEASNLGLLSNQANHMAAIETMNNSLFANVAQLTERVNQITFESELNTMTMNYNNREVERTFEDVETVLDNSYRDVCQRLNILEKSLGEKDKTIALLAAKVESQGQLLEKLLKLVIMIDIIVENRISWSTLINDTAISEEFTRRVMLMLNAYVIASISGISRFYDAYTPRQE